MSQYPRFQRGGGAPRSTFQPRPYSQIQRGTGTGQFSARNCGYNPRQSRPYFDRGRARGGNSASRRFNGNPQYPSSSGRGRGQTSSNNQQYRYDEDSQTNYGYEEEVERGQFDMPVASYGKTDSYSTGSAANKNADGNKSNETSNKAEFDVELVESYENEASSYIDQLEGEFDQGEEDEGYEDNAADDKNNKENGDAGSNKKQMEEQTSKNAETADVKPSDPSEPDQPKPADNNEGKADQEEEEEEGDSDSSEEDTGFCKYCNLTFTSTKAFHTHTRGIQHTTLVMEAKASKGNKHYQKEVVDAEVLKVVIPEPKPPEEPKEEEDEEFDLDSLNWMEMEFDDDTKDYIRNKRKTRPEDRDLNPDDIGRNQFVDKYTCPLCDCKCTGALSFKMHIQGKQHKSNMEQVQRGGPLKKKKSQAAGLVIDTLDRKAKLTDQLKDTKNAIIGLEYVTEFQKPDINAAVRYVCNLCESKCDSSTIISHLIGIKHRLRYFQAKRPSIYEHLTKYSSKKNKSEMNHSAEDFARDIANDHVKADIVHEVKVKLELGEVEEDLEETMTRTSKALKETMATLEQRKDFPPPPEKRSRYGDEDDYYNRRPHPPHPGHRDYPPRDYPPRDYPPRDYPPRGYPPRGYPSRDDPRRDYPPRDYPPRGFAEEHYEAYRRDPYDSAYRDRFAYRYKDPYYDRIFDDEKRRLDLMMERRYRLSDPVLERQRVEDIITRREYLERQDKARIDDILERRRRLHITQPPKTDDVDYDRLKRFENRALPSESRSRQDTAERERRAEPVSSRPKYEERPDMEELLARRRGLDYGDRPKVDSDLAPRAASSQAKEQQDRVVKALQAEVVKNPNINITEIMAKLKSSSTITSEVDAAMALEISNALTNALLQYRLQNAPKEIQAMASAQPVALPSIPGLGSGASSAASSHVPSFLRTSAVQSSQSEYATHTTQSTQGSHYHMHTSQVDYSYPSVQQQRTSPYQQAQEYTNQSSGYGSQYSQQSQDQSAYHGQQSQAPSVYHSQQSQAQSAYHGQQSQAQSAYHSQQWQVQSGYHGQQSQAQANVSQAVLQLKSPVSQLTYSQAAKLPALAQSIAGSNKSEPQGKQSLPVPAKLLESIRQQTELLKQRLANASSNNYSGIGEQGHEAPQAVPDAASPTREQEHRAQPLEDSVEESMVASDAVTDAAPQTREQENGAEPLEDSVDESMVASDAGTDAAPPTREQEQEKEKAEFLEDSDDESLVDSDAEVWVMGDAIAYWAGRRAAERGTPNLGLKSAKIDWLGVSGLGWKGLRKIVEPRVLLSTPPTVIVINLGGNDLVEIPIVQIKVAIRHEIKYLRDTFPQTTIVWMDILRRQLWEGAYNNKKIVELKRRRVNRIGREIVHSSGKGKSDVIKPEIEAEMAFFEPDGIHLNMMGLEFYLDTISDVVKKYIEVD